MFNQTTGRPPCLTGRLPHLTGRLPCWQPGSPVLTLPRYSLVAQVSVLALVFGIFGRFRPFFTRFLLVTPFLGLPSWFRCFNMLHNKGRIEQILKRSYIHDQFHSTVRFKSESITVSVIITTYNQDTKKDILVFLGNSWGSSPPAPPTPSTLHIWNLLRSLKHVSTNRGHVIKTQAA